MRSSYRLDLGARPCLGPTSLTCWEERVIHDFYTLFAMLSLSSSHRSTLVWCMGDGRG